MKRTKNNKTARGEYYSTAMIETIDYLEGMMVALLKNNIPPESAYDIVCALKYLSSRLGSKDDTSYELDLLKAENYIHRARTGNWLDKMYLRSEEEAIDESASTR
mgnify:CR=1 FL=1